MVASIIKRLNFNIIRLRGGKIHFEINLSIKVDYLDTLVTAAEFIKLKGISLSMLTGENLVLVGWTLFEKKDDISGTGNEDEINMEISKCDYLLAKSLHVSLLNSWDCISSIKKTKYAAPAKLFDPRLIDFRRV